MKIDANEGVSKVLVEARRLEQDGRAFYLESAERTKSKKGREMFLSLAEAEALHQRLVRREIDSLAKDGKWVELPEAREPRRDLSQSVFPRGREGLEKAVGADASETEALVLSLELEAKSYELYRREAQSANDSAAKGMYEFLAGQERTHFDVLMAAYETLVHYGGWAEL
jgi:rubrerythrin